MKTLYLECNMGAAGDMLTAALIELIPAPDAFLEKIKALGLHGVRVSRSRVEKCGVMGSHITVEIGGKEEHVHDAPHHLVRKEGDMERIRGMVAGFSVSDKVKKDILAVYGMIAEAEASVHGALPEDIHFHELGTMDALCDIAGVCLLMEEINPERVIASPVTTGYGFVRCAHGMFPVPAPATALLLRGIPTKRGIYEGEMCTPTGAALLKYFADEFGADPVMAWNAVGYGMGTMDFDSPNCVRAFLGEAEGKADRIFELKCNLDDMTPEAIGYAQQLLLEEGALDVFVTPVQMKKNRPGVLLACLCAECDAERLSMLLLKETTTAGVRRCPCERYKLETGIITVRTVYGKTRVKTYTGYGIKKIKPEYDDIAALCAKNADVPFDTVYRAAVAEAEKSGG